MGQGDPGRTAAAHRHEEPDDQPQYLGGGGRAPGACGTASRGKGISGLALDRLLARLPQLGRHRLVGQQVRRRARVRAGLPGAQAGDGRPRPHRRRVRGLQGLARLQAPSQAQADHPELNARSVGALKSGNRRVLRPQDSISMTSTASDGLTVLPLLRDLGRAPYEPTVDAMKAFPAGRTPATPDEVWLVEHAPVFTQGLAGKAEHLLDAGAVPVVQTNRGGQVTY